MTTIIQPSRNLADPIIVVDIANTLKEIKDQIAWQNNGHSAKTVLKHNDFRVVLISMKKNTHIPQHKADGSITIHTLGGHLRIQTPNQSIELKNGQLLALDPSIPHDLSAIDETVFLLSISAAKRT